MKQYITSGATCRRDRSRTNRHFALPYLCHNAFVDWQAMVTNKFVKMNLNVFDVKEKPFSEYLLI